MFRIMDENIKHKELREKVRKKEKIRDMITSIYVIAVANLCIYF